MDKHHPMEEKLVRSEPIYDGKILSLERWTVELPNAKLATREIVKHFGASAIVPVDENGRVPMVTQFRCAFSKQMMEIPAGKFDSPGEDPLACAKRELKEETGLTAKNWRYLMGYVPSPGYLTEVVHLFLATGLEAGNTQPDEDEFLEVDWYPLDTLVQMVLDGKIQDGKTAVALLMAKSLLA